MSKRNRQMKGPFVAIPLTILDAPAWRIMDPIARLLWISLRRKLRNDGLNNGKIYLSCRDAAPELGVHRNTVFRRFADLEHYGFVRKTSEGCLGVDGYGIAPHYRFTDLAYGTHPATRDYEKWDGVLSPRREWGWKKQNPVPVRVTPRPRASDIRKGVNGGSLCPRVSDISEPQRCPRVSDISRLPSPTAREEPTQGSLTVRAPVQAGGAGSSPVPVARPDLTTVVLSIVNAQLDELEWRGCLTWHSLLCTLPNEPWRAARALRSPD